jgi:sulfate adenylyltransferase subunit 1
VLPSGVESSVARIVTFDGDLQEAAAGKRSPRAER